MANTPSNTHATTQAIAKMSAYGTLGASPEWRALLPLEISGVTAATEQARHETIDATNQHEPGSTVGLTAETPLSVGLTYEAVAALLPGAMRTNWSGPRALVDAATRPTSATSAHFVVPAMADALPASTLVKVSGCAVAANNGVKVVASGGSTTQIPITGGLTAETFTAAQNVTIEVCGYQFASGDLTLTSSGGVNTLATTTKDLTELSLASGQAIWIGDTSAAAYSFATTADYGPARLTATPNANAMTVDGTFGTFSTDNGSGKTIRVFFGRTARVVGRDSGSYAESYYQVETAIENLGAANATHYLYTENGAIGSFEISAPSGALATVSAQLMGTDVTNTDTRRTNASTPTLAKRTIAYNTTSDISGRLFLASDGTALTGYVTSATLTIDNAASMNPAHGILGSAITTFGKVTVTLAMDVFLTESALLTAARNNYEVRGNVWIRNGDGAIVLDIPAGRLAVDSAAFPAGQVVTIPATLTASRDSTWGTSLIASLIPGCPALIARS